MKHFKIFTSAMIFTMLLSNLILAETTRDVRTFGSFDSIKFVGSGDAKIIHGDKNEVVIYAPSDLIPYLETEVEHGTLVIGKMKNTWKKFHHFHEDIRYEIVVKDIESLKITGSCDAELDKLSGSKCSINISGSGSVDVDQIDSEKTILGVSGSGDIEANMINSENINIAISGSGNIDVAGKTQVLDISIAGSGDVDGDQLKSKTATVSISGSGSATFGCSDYLEANTAGSGDITCIGNPSLRSHSTGSGSVVTR